MGGSTPTDAEVGHLSLGRAGYEETLRLQRRLRERRLSEAIGDVVITVEHDPVLTMGRSGSLDNLLVSRETLDGLGVSLVEVERGGDITYHGPGQLVVYPILDLREHGRDLGAYVRGLEETILRVLSSYGVAGERVEGRPGVWVEGRKIASLGIHVRRWVTLHGAAFNVDVDRSHFALIRPCGLPVDVVSLSDLVTSEISVGDVADRFLRAAEAVFGWTVRSVQLEELGGRADEPTA